MTIELWIDQLQLEQMMSNIEDAASAAEEPFENLVEYTTLPACLLYTSDAADE